MLNRNQNLIVLVLCCIFAACTSPKPFIQKKNIYQRLPIEEVSQFRLETDAIFIDAVTIAELGNDAEAFELYQKVLERDSTYAAAHYEIASLYFAKRNVEKAIDESKKAIALNSKNIWYQLQLAGIYQQSFRHTEACKVYESIVQQNPEIPEYYEEWARALLIANKPEEAIKVYNTLEKRIGVNEELSMQKEKIWRSMGQPDKAIAEIENLSSTYSNEIKYNAILAEIYMSTKNYNKAYIYYKKIKEINPYDKYIDVSLASYYRKVNEPEKAYQSLKAAFQNTSLDETTKVQLLLSFYSLEEFYSSNKDEALSLLEILYAQYPKNTIILPIYGDVLLKDKKYEEALAIFKESIEVDSSRYEIWEALLFTELELNKDSLVFVDAKKAIELFPTQPLPYYFYALGLIQKKEYAAAFPILKKGERWVVDNNNLLSEFYSLSGECYYREKEYEESDKYMRKALQINPENYGLLNNFAYYLSERSVHLDEAETMSKKTIEKDSVNPTFLDTYAWILFKQKNYSNALVYIEKAIAYDTDISTVVLEHYADILYKTGNHEKAKEYWKKAYSKNKEKGSEHLKIKAETGVYRN